MIPPHFSLEKIGATIRADLAALDWSSVDVPQGIRCAIAIILTLLAGSLAGEAAAGAVACGGALTVGLGATQNLARTRLAPMLAGALGMGISTFIGTVAGLSPPALAAAGLVWGFACGLLPSMGGGAQWVGQQCGICMLVAASLPRGGDNAIYRTWLVLGGGIAQVIVVELLMRFSDVGVEIAGWRETAKATRAGVLKLLANLSPRSPHFRFALREAVALSLAMMTARLLDLPNGYWVGMTTLVLLRLDFHETWTRSIGRIAGTLVGTGLAIAAAEALPNHGEGSLELGALVVGFAGCCFAFQKFSYTVFSAWLTGAIVALLLYAGLAQQVVVEGRVAGTVLGAVFAMGAHLHFYLRRSKGREMTPAAAS